MASINIQNLLVQLNQEIQNATSASDYLILSRAVSILKSGSVISVPSFSQLPSAEDNLGSLFLVENEKLLYYSFKSDYDGKFSWVPITQLNYSTLWSWGCNNFGTLGDGSAFNRNSPGSIVGDGNTWKVFCAGGYHSAGIKDDGTLWTWGCNGQGRLGDGTTVNRSSPGTVAGGGTNWCQLSMGYFSAAAVKTDGTLWTWGCNGSGVLGENTTTNRCSPGTVAGISSTWTCVEFGRCHSIGLKNDGTLWTWGLNNFGQLGDGTTVSRCSPGTTAVFDRWWIKIAAGKYHTLAVADNSTFGRPTNPYHQTKDIPQKVVSIWSWGNNAYGQLGTGNFTSRCSPGVISNNSFLCSTYAAGNSSFSVGITLNLWGWGRNNYGQLGDGTTTNRTTTCLLPTYLGPRWCAMSTNGYTSAAVRIDGTIWTWGRNSSAGILGDGTTLNRCSPGTISGSGNTWSKVSIGLCNIIANTLES